MTTKKLDCSKCRGCCCEFMLLPSYVTGPDQIRWLNYHDKIKVITRNGVKWIKVDIPCSKLVDGKCSIYKNRPSICKEFDCREWKEFFVKKPFAPDEADVLADILDKIAVEYSEVVATEITLPMKPRTPKSIRTFKYDYLKEEFHSYSDEGIVLLLREVLDLSHPRFIVEIPSVGEEFGMEIKGKVVKFKRLKNKIKKI